MPDIRIIACEQAPTTMPTADHLTKAFQWDLGRQVERLDFLLPWLPRYAGWGYEELYLHLEDAVEFPSLPGVARRDAYSRRQFARLVDAATAAGIRVVPIVNLLGHTQYLIKTPALRDLNELRDARGRPLDRGQICPLHPRTLAVAAKLLDDMAPFCTAGKVHVGLDESFQLGRCPRCRAEIRSRGLAAHFAGHVQRLHRLAADRGLRLGLWADMLALLPEAIPDLPRDVIAYDWYYYPFGRHPRVELRNFAEVDLATPLHARGIEYWGCPMNGAFRYEPLPVFGERLANILAWWRRCRRVGAGGLLVTSWEPNRLALELTTVVDAAAACLWLDPGIEDPPEMLARGFARVFGGGGAGRRPALSESRRDACATVGTRRWAQTALAGDPYAFAGYHRWQINERWDVCAERGGLKRAEGELRALERICGAGSPWLAEARRRRSDPSTGGGERQDRGRRHREMPPYNAGYPPALSASLAFRLYLARRDVFVRRAAQGVFRLRREGFRSAVLQPALNRKDYLLRQQGITGREIRAAPKRGLKHRATLAKFRASVDRLQREAAAFAAALKAGRAAARIMWARSRDRRIRGPNELMLGRDAARLRAWQGWLRQAVRDPAIVGHGTPVCGAWQLQFTVHHFAPAMQKIVVEQRKAGGSWQTLHETHLIEFRAFAARPRTRIHREFSVPAAAPGHGALRLAARGLGQIEISHVELTNGVVSLRSTGWPAGRRTVLGCPAPRRGFPPIPEARPSRLRLAFEA